MFTSQCFACLSILPIEGATKQGVASTLNNFQTEIKDLLKINGKSSKIDKNNDLFETREQVLCENLSVCSKCLSCIKLVISSKHKVDLVEYTVRKLQMDLLKQLRKLEKCLEVLWEEMEEIGGIIQNSNSGGRQPITDYDDQLTDDVWIFRKDILDVKGHLQLFRNGIRNSTLTTAYYPDDRNTSEIPLPTSIKIKTEPETNDFNQNVPEEIPDDLNFMDHNDIHLDNPPSDTDESPNEIPASDPAPKLKKWSRLPHKCPKCSKTFPLKSSLSKHLRLQHPNHLLQQIISCPHCHQSMSRQLLRTHKLHHCPSLKKNRPPSFLCSFCKINFQNIESLKCHNLEIHQEKIKFMCSTCGKISASTQAYQQHQIIHEDPKYRQVLECPDCGKIILAVSVSSHRRFGCPKRENKSFLCQFCQEYFSTESSLKRHVLRKHEGQQMDQDQTNIKFLKKPIGQGQRRKIRVIAEEDDHDNHYDKLDDKEDMEDSNSDSDFIPSDGEINEKITSAAIKCPNCPKTFPWPQDLKKHQIAQHPNDWLSESSHCPHCMETMPRKLLRTHSYYHCPAKPKDIIYSCTLCKPTMETDPDKFQSPKFPDLESLKGHVAAEHPRKMLTLICDICGLISPSLDCHLKHQVRHVHPKDRELVECEDCGKSILATSISSHRRLGCPKRERVKFPCIYCPKLFTTEMSVVRHVSRWHTGVNGEVLVKPRRPRKLQCHLCGKWIQDKGQMKRHLRTRHSSWEERGDEKCVCEFCGKEMLSVSLGQHEKYYCKGKESAGVEQVPCEICGKGFKSVSIMGRHRKVVHGNERFECEICGKGFRAKRNMMKHVERHKGLRKFKCELGCGMVFKQKAHLKRHEGLGYCMDERGPRKQRRSKLEVVGKVEGVNS